MRCRRSRWRSWCDPVEDAYLQRRRDMKRALNEQRKRNSRKAAGQSGRAGMRTSRAEMLERRLMMAAGLVGGWGFEENGGGTTVDASGNNNVGTLNGATWTT